MSVLMSMEPADIIQVLAIQDELGFQHWTAEQFRAELEQRYTLAFVQKNGIMIEGFAIWHLLGDEAELCSVAVARLQQNRGIGSSMMRSMHEILRKAGAERFFLEVRAGNVPAQALYLKLGYAVVGKRRKYYSDGEDAVLMTGGGAN